MEPPHFWASRKTIYTLGKHGRLRVFQGPDVKHARGLISEGPRWAYIPIEDVARYAEEVGRPFVRERRVIFRGLCAGLCNAELRGLQGRHFARGGLVWVSADIARVEASAGFR